MSAVEVELEEDAARQARCRVVLLQTTVPAYRELFVRTLRERLGGQLDVLAGGAYFDPTVTLDVERESVILVRNRFLLRRRLLWQSRVVRRAVRAGVVIAELNPRILSTWVLLLLRRALGRPMVLWGHAWPRRGADVWTDTLRGVMRRLGSGVIVYSESEADQLKRTMPGTLVAAAPNGLYSRAARQRGTTVQPPNDFVFVGRIVEAKKPALLLEAFIASLDELPPETRLVFVGEGPLRPMLAAEAETRAPGRVAFAGARWTFEELQQTYSGALASVIPGYAGLSLTQSLWFGVPALIADDEPHSPEIEAAEEGVNALFFSSDSVSSLSSALLSVARDRASWRARRPEIARECAARYSVEAMVEAHVRTIESVRR